MISIKQYAKLIPFIFLIPLAATQLSGCKEKDPETSARIVASKIDLIQGTRGLGDVGDYRLENDKIRLIIQKAGYSRGFGIYGGGILDADLRRPNESGATGTGFGNDSFGELFPIFFLQATAVDEVEVVSDGSDGMAVIVSRGTAGEFMTMLGVLDRAATGSHTDFMREGSDDRLRYETFYELEAGKQYVTIKFRVTNVSEDKILNFPGDDVTNLSGILGFDAGDFTIPVGEVALFGATSRVFLPGLGYDTRFPLFASYDRGIELPAFPGVVSDWIATSSDNKVSYGLLAAESDLNYVYNKRDIYADGVTPITKSSMLLPFVTGDFLGLFYTEAPRTLNPKEYFEVEKYFIIGSGDVGSVLDIINEIQGVSVGKISGLVMDQISGQPAEKASVIIYQRMPDDSRRLYSQYHVKVNGQFHGTLVPGGYSARVTGKGRPLSDFVDFDVWSNHNTKLTMEAKSPGRINVSVWDDLGNRLPAKATIVGTYGPEYVDQETRHFLFDLAAGESWRSSDYVTDTKDDSSTRRYIEAVEPTHEGVANLLVRPNCTSETNCSGSMEYEVVISRGPEYNTVSQMVKVAPGQTVSVTGTLVRVVDTSGWIAGDMHLHSVLSLDSPMEMNRRARMLAAEGVEYAVSTDHNLLSDFGPTVAKNNLSDWLYTTVGLELTTMESGHFNGYPLKYQPGPITHGSFEWSGRPPSEIFEELRNLGSLSPEKTIVQVNHPRDTTLGYFEQYRRHPVTGKFMSPDPIAAMLAPSGPAFMDGMKSAYSEDFDAIELVNGKRYDLIRTYRVPEALPPGEMPEVIPEAGTVMIDADGQVAFPGGVEDWFNLLNMGHRYISVGNSDSHKDAHEEGFPRTMIYVGEDVPFKLTDEKMVDSMHGRRVVITTGPLVDFYINEPEVGAMGKTIVDSDGTVEITIKITAAPWISVGRLNIIRNGLLADKVMIDEDRDLVADPFEQTMTVEMAKDDSGNYVDSWFLVEVIGYRSYFPVVRPLELKPLLITDAIGSLAGAFGFGGNEFADLKPSMTHLVTSYALTNPTWVTLTEGEFTPPGTNSKEVFMSAENDPGMSPVVHHYKNLKQNGDYFRGKDGDKEDYKKQDPRKLILYRDRKNRADILNIFRMYDQ